VAVEEEDMEMTVKVVAVEEEDMEMIAVIVVL